MEISYTKKDKGHNVHIDSQWVMWVIGSLTNAKKEINNYLNK